MCLDTFLRPSGRAPRKPGKVIRHDAIASTSGARTHNELARTGGDAHAHRTCSGEGTVHAKPLRDDKQTCEVRIHGLSRRMRGARYSRCNMRASSRDGLPAAREAVSS